MAGSKVTIKDIASEAGVSPALVSFVLKNKSDGTRVYRVKPETAAHVLEVASRLHYRPNMAAQTLKSGRSRTIGIIIPDVTSPFFAEFIKYVEDDAYSHGYSVLFGNSDEDAGRLARLKDVFINRGVDGLVIVPCEHSDNMILEMAHGDVPLVLVDREVPGFDGPTVLLDNYQAFRDLTAALAGRGYRKIEMLSYAMNVSILPDRERGYSDCMRESGLEDNIRFHRFPRNCSREKALKTYRSAQERGVEALVFATNTLALAGMADMYAAGINKNFGIACFGHNDAFDIFDNEVIYARQPAQAFSKAVVGKIMDLMEGAPAVTGERIILNSEIIQ